MVETIKNLVEEIYKTVSKTTKGQFLQNVAASLLVAACDYVKAFEDVTKTLEDDSKPDNP